MDGGPGHGHGRHILWRGGVLSREMPETQGNPLVILCMYTIDILKYGSIYNPDELKQFLYDQDIIIFLNFLI